jgi:GT2 family glycosyltransferase
MSQNKTIAVLLTVHNRKDKTTNCIAKLLDCKKKGFDLRVYLTDDGCTDGTKDAVLNLLDNVKIIKGDGSLFWNRGMLAAWMEASKDSPDFYLWLNDDTELLKDSLIRLIECSNLKNDKSIIVGSTWNNPSELVLSYGGRSAKRRHPIIPPSDKDLIQCDTFNGNIVLIPAYVFARVGYNDSYYRHSFGDIDYGIMASNQGIESYIATGFYGYCERNNPIPLFRRKCYSLIKRYKLLYSPLGHNPLEDFHQNHKIENWFKCALIFIKLHINVLFPKDHTKFEK